MPIASSRAAIRTFQGCSPALSPFVREVPIYCRDHRCSHHVATNADGWSDHIRLSDV
jgi:hypothetical protein